MKINRLKSLKGGGTAFLLVLAGFALAWLCFRIAVERILPVGSPVAAAVSPNNPDVILSLALSELIEGSRRLSEPTSVTVRRTAATRPLDARPYLIFGSQAANAGRPARAIQLLEAGQRLDPRQRLINGFLLEQYLKTAQYDKAAQQFGVLSRLVRGVDAPITEALVLMTTNSETLPAVRQTLADDSRLESQVLSTLAAGKAEPERIFALASHKAIVSAGSPNGWGSVLINRLVLQGKYSEAKQVWRRVFKISKADSSGLIYNSNFDELPGSEPFNWTFAADGMGVADPLAGKLSVEYYGRDRGDLASQLLLLRPGTYQFYFNVEGGKAEAESRLSWQIVCTHGKKPPLMDAGVAASPDARPRTAQFKVTAGCPAQTLRLHGEPGEFPDSITLTIRDVAIRALDRQT